jgi:hypothetical protein
MSNYQKQYAAAKKAGKTTNLTPDYIRWSDKGQQIMGEYISQNEVASGLGTGTYKQYVFDTDDGLKKFALGSAADSEFSGVLAPGFVYCLTYEGKEKIAKGRSVNRFTLEQIDMTEDLTAEENKQADGNKKK